MSQAHRIGLVEARPWARPRSRPAVDLEVGAEHGK